MSWFLYCTIGFFVGMFFTLFVVALCNAASSPVHNKLELIRGGCFDEEVTKLWRDNPEWFEDKNEKK